MMKTAVLGLVMTAAGCAPLVAKLKGDDGKATVPPADVKAAIIEGSVQIYADDWTKKDFSIGWRYDAKRLLDAYGSAGVSFVLDGPGVHETHTIGNADHAHTTWDSDWPAGAYTLVLQWNGKELARRSFVVRMAPLVAGGGIPVVDSSPELPVTSFRHSFQTMVAVDVTKPTVTVQQVWMKGTTPMGEPNDSVESIGPLHQGGPLGEYKETWKSVPQDVDLTGATLYVFLDGGVRLVGAFSYVDDSAVTVAFPRVAKPDPKQLAAARAVAAAIGENDARTLPEYAAVVDEPTVCAVVASASAREVYKNAERAKFDANYSMNQQLDAQDAQDRAVTRAERAEARQRQSDAASLTIASGQAQIKNAAALRAFIRKFKPGCMAKLGVPAMATTKLP